MLEEIRKTEKEKEKENMKQCLDASGIVSEFISSFINLTCLKLTVRGANLIGGGEVIRRRR